MLLRSMCVEKVFHKKEGKRRKGVEKRDEERKYGTKTEGRAGGPGSQS